MRLRFHYCSVTKCDYLRGLRQRKSALMSNQAKSVQSRSWIGLKQGNVPMPHMHAYLACKKDVDTYPCYAVLNHECSLFNFVYVLQNSLKFLFLFS